MLRNVMTAVATLSLLVITSAAVADEAKSPSSPFSANVSLTSEYMFRGISQTNGRAAVQGGFDYERSLFGNLSIYAGTWGSNVDFGDGGEANIEVDYFGGVKTTVGNLGLDVGVAHYTYPGASKSLNYTFTEVIGKASYDVKVATLNAGVNYSPNFFADSGEAVYVSAGVEVPVMKVLTLAANVGHQSIEDNSAFGTPDYVDYSVGVSGSVYGFDVGVTFTDTNLSESDCFGGSTACGRTVTVSASRSF